MVKYSVSLNLPPQSKGKKKLSISAMVPSTSEKKQSDPEGDFRRSKRFRSKVLNFWDFERIAVLETEEGAKTTIIKDVPGEGTIVLQGQDSDHEETCTSVFLKKNCHGETGTSESKLEPQSVNKSVATKASRKKRPVPDTLPSSDKSAIRDALKKSDAHPNGGKINDETNSKNATRLKRPRSSKPASDDPMLATGSIGCQTRRRKSCKSNDQFRTRPNSHDAEGEEAEVRGVRQRCSTPFAATRNSKKKMEGKCSSSESSKCLQSKRLLELPPMDSESIEMKSGEPIPIPKSTLEASIDKTPRDGCQGTSSVTPAQVAQAGPSNADAPATSAVGAGVRNGGTFIKGSNLVFQGSSNSSNSAAAATGEFALAKGGAQGDVETYFLHLRKGYVAFVAPKDMKLFVVRGCGHCSLLGEGTPTVVNLLLKCGEVNAEKGAKLLVSVVDNCPELIVCLMLYDSVQV